MTYRTSQKKVARIRIAGPDRKGIIAAVTGLLSKHNCNIEDIDQRILEGYLIMNMLVDYTDLALPLKDFTQKLEKVAAEVGTETIFQKEEKKLIKNVAVLVTTESHCLVDLLEKMKTAKLKGKAVIVIGNQEDLSVTVRKYHVPFHYSPSDRKKAHEQEILELLKKHEVDLVVLARYMQILSPEFVFRYEGKIINIHPSLLPAFPGPRAYHQAFNRGVEIVGVTAHFVTTALDEGPIITQDCFRVDKTRDTVEHILEKGRNLEAKVLTKAVKLFLEDRLTLRRGKVIDSKKEYALAKKAQEFYQEQES